MKIIQSQINNAYASMHKIAGMQLPIKQAYAIYLLSKKIKEHFDFFVEQEKKLIEKYNAEIKDNGTISFSNQEDAIKFQEEYNDYQAFEIEEDFTPITLKFADCGEQNITPADIANLESFIAFEE